jgi:hypothetical protein
LQCNSRHNPAPVPRSETKILLPVATLLIACRRAADKPKMGRFGLGTRIAMIALGAIWGAAGAAWLYCLGPDIVAATASRRIVTLATALLLGGLALLKTGITPDRPKAFEDEIADAHPDLGGDDWSDIDD